MKPRDTKWYRKSLICCVSRGLFSRISRKRFKVMHVVYGTQLEDPRIYESLADAKNTIKGFIERRRERRGNRSEKRGLDSFDTSVLYRDHRVIRVENGKDGTKRYDVLRPDGKHLHKRFKSIDTAIPHIDRVIKSEANAGSPQPETAAGWKRNCEK